MKIDIHKITVLLFISTLSACSIIKQEKIPFQIEHQKLLTKEFELKMPHPFHMQKDNYEEGIIYFYSFVDSAYIIVFEGALMEFPIDKYQIQYKQTTDQRVISIGIENNKFWRKDVLSGIRIYYDNVSSKNKKKYDKVLDEIKIRPL